MNEIKQVRKWFWAWNDDKEEQWLTGMAQQGWHLKTPGMFGLYSFEQGDARNDVYRLDFKTAGKDMDEYLQLFVDSGWEYVGAMGSWQYFRKQCAEGEDAEIYTDNASKIQKYQRVLLFLVILMPTLMMTINNVVRIDEMEGFLAGFVGAISAIGGVLMLLYIYAMVRIFMRIQELKK